MPAFFRRRFKWKNGEVVVDELRQALHRRGRKPHARDALVALGHVHLQGGGQAAIAAGSPGRRGDVQRVEGRAVALEQRCQGRTPGHRRIELAEVVADPLEGAQEEQQPR